MDFSSFAKIFVAIFFAIKIALFHRLCKFRVGGQAADIFEK